jgi:hypothetical protein
MRAGKSRDTTNQEATMRRVAAVWIGGLLACCPGLVAADERTLGDLPKDAWDVASVVTEPVKGMARGARRLDPISGLWRGLLEGSARSVERTADLLLNALQADPIYDSAASDYIDALDICEPPSANTPYRRAVATANRRSQENF